ncbi:MAG: protein TolR [Gammaproteobacteria bacterium RIFCSPHIGHO2_12_FULL_35_23]|nr:MAG: protein TolR [Gammaproteobacteria bacterium RIFCSPHIGHO2_12_FULL_35_23]
MRNSRRRSQRRHLLSEINIVPYIDVMLVLLIIFMITAPLLSQGVHVNLPKANANTISVKNTIPIIITVDKAGNYYVNVSPTPNIPVTAQQLINLVAAEEVVAEQENNKRPVYVKGDTDASYGEVVQAMALLQTAGVKTVGLLTKNPDEQESSMNDSRT